MQIREVNHVHTCNSLAQSHKQTRIQTSHCTLAPLPHAPTEQVLEHLIERKDLTELQSEDMLNVRMQACLHTF